MKKILQIAFSVFFIASLAISCNSEAGESSNPKTEEETSEIYDSNGDSEITVTSATGQTVDTNGGIDLNDWGVQIRIPARTFSHFQAGSKISITTKKSQTCTSEWEYYNLKFYAPSSSWSEITGGNFENASYNNVIVPTNADGVFSYTVTADNATLLKNHGLIIIGYGLVITNISTSKTEISTSENAQTETKTDVWSGTQDFNSWSVNIQIPAEKFSSFFEGSKIQVEWRASSTATEYKKLQFDAMGSTWTELTGGAFTGGTTDSDKGVKPESSPLSYTVTAANASSLKSNGLALMGYGVVVTKITLISGGTQAESSTESANPTAVETKATPVLSDSDTPFSKHGKLHVSGAYLLDEHNEKYQLYGMSTHGITFGDEFSRYVNEDAFQTLRDDWNTNCVRIVLYPRDYNGYLTGGDKAKLKSIVKNGIEAATKKGMYVLVDWHVHNYNPQETQSEAIEFLSEISKEYAKYGNVLYEICNEPTNSPWNSAIKPYAEKVISEIRKYAPDAVVIVGTNTWSQDVEEALASPLSPATYGNVMYTFHFYANSHTQTYRARVESAITKGLPIFITEFGTCDASGNGGFNESESKAWFDLCKKYSISHLNWSLSNKGETASAIQSSCSKTSAWAESDLTESGKLVKMHFINDCKR